MNWQSTIALEPAEGQYKPVDCLAALVSASLAVSAGRVHCRIVDGSNRNREAGSRGGCARARVAKLGGFRPYKGECEASWDGRRASSDGIGRLGAPTPSPPADDDRDHMHLGCLGVGRLGPAYRRAFTSQPRDHFRTCLSSSPRSNAVPGHRAGAVSAPVLSAAIAADHYILALPLEPSMMVTSVCRRWSLLG